jgi:hypothetical protein
MTTTLWDVLQHHNGSVIRSSGAPLPEHITLHLAFNNVADKQHFSYAMRIAWSPITVINRPGTINLDIVVPLGVALVQAL